MKSKRSDIFKIILVTLCIFAISQLLFSISNLWRKKDITRERLMVLEREKEINMELKHKITLYHSQFWIEKQIRERLGLARPGETVIIPSKPSPQATASAQSGDLPVLQKWWRLFFGAR